LWTSWLLPVAVAVVMDVLLAVALVATEQVLELLVVGRALNLL
jgi:hypothetical protein